MDTSRRVFVIKRKPERKTITVGMPKIIYVTLAKISYLKLHLRLLYLYYNNMFDGICTVKEFDNSNGHFLKN